MVELEKLIAIDKRLVHEESSSIVSRDKIVGRVFIARCILLVLNPRIIGIKSYSLL